MKKIIKRNKNKIGRALSSCKWKKVGRYYYRRFDGAFWRESREVVGRKL